MRQVAARRLYTCPREYGSCRTLHSTPHIWQSNSRTAPPEDHEVPSGHEIFRSDHYVNDLPHPSETMKRAGLCQQPRARELIHQMLRVDLAGEAAAVGMYQGQLAVLKNTSEGRTIRVGTRSLGMSS